MWPGIVLGVGGFMLSIALIPTVLTKAPPHRLTCLLTGAVLISFSVAMIEEGLFLGAFAVIIQAAIWLWMLMQERS